MKWREFVTFVGGLAAAWPVAVRAQQAKVVRLGYLDPAKPTDTIAANLRRQLLLGMRDLSYIKGRHFKMEDRYAEGRIDRLPALASELALLPIDIFVVFGDAPIRAAMQASDRIPIGMTVAAEPVGSGFINSLAHPGGSITGMGALTPFVAGKRLELLKEIIPSTAQVAVLWNPSNQAKIAEWNDTSEANSCDGVSSRRPRQVVSPQQSSHAGV
jgi:putative ABC transport system substrate-binding protein